MISFGKILTWLVSPLTVFMIALFVGMFCLGRSRRRLAMWILMGATLGLLVWSTPVFCVLMRGGLMQDFPPQPIDALPTADAIVVLGGGMVGPLPPVIYPEFGGPGNRCWHAARLYKAGKAPLVIPSGIGEEEATIPFLKDMGVPESAICLEPASRNTEENALFTARLLSRKGLRRVLLVTSAWHMRRSMFLFKSVGVDVVPVATDYGASVSDIRGERRSLLNQLPNAGTLSDNTVMFKEYLGYWVYRVWSWMGRSHDRLLAGR